MEKRRTVPIGAVVMLAGVWVSAMVTGAEAASGSAATVPAEAPTGQVITGIVLNYNGGGIDAARVRIEALEAGKNDPPLAETVTNGLGEINVRLPRPVSGPVRVRIQKEGYAEVVQEVDPTDKDNPPFVDATLEGTGRLSGKVVEAGTGKPIAGARVECGNGGRTLTAQADAKGEFAFANIVRGPAHLVFMADGFGTEQEKLTIGEYRINLSRSLRPERPIEIVVDDNEGKAAPGVLIEALVEPTFDYLTARTDTSGRARLAGVNRNAIAVHLRMNGDRYVRSTEYVRSIPLAPIASQAASGPAMEKRRFTVRIAGGVKGKVIDAKTREPIIGVRVIAGREVRGDMPMTWTEDDGTYELNGLEPGFNVISLQHGDYTTGIREVRLPAGGVTTLDAEMGAGQPIEGVVVSAKGEPLDQVRVSAESWKSYTTLGMRVITGEDGKFSIPHAPPGEVTFSFIRPGYGMLEDQVLTAGKRDYRIKLEEMQEPSSPAAGGGRPEKIKLGEPVPDLTLTTTDGTRYKLSELRGKCVFLDCWASWCGPCVGEIPNVKALRDATKNRPDFVMIGVSLDTNKSAFSAALARHSIDWPQAFGPKSGAQEAFDVLDGYGIPYTCLIGPDGKLLAQHLRGPGLDKQVQKYFAEGKEFLPPGNQDYKLRQMEPPSQQVPQDKRFLRPPSSQPGGQ